MEASTRASSPRSAFHAPSQMSQRVARISTSASASIHWIAWRWESSAPKVERPDGDDARRWGPPFRKGVSPAFLAVNANKRSITLDLKDPQAVAWLTEFVGDADVLVQNLRPGSLEELGLGPDALAARWLTWEGAWKADRGEDARVEASIAKLYSSEVLWRVIDAAVQIHGGYGVSKEFPLERWYREARVRRIGEGPSEVHRMVIARSLFR